MAAFSKKLTVGTALLLGIAALGAWAYMRPAPVLPGDAVWYAHASATDPIFALDGTDSDRLDAAIRAFLSQARSIADGYDGTAAQKNILRTSLYPARFLTRLPALQAARDLLLSDPTPEHATRYHSLLTDTIDAYERDAEAWVSAAHDVTLNGSIGFLTGTTSPALMAQRLTLAAQYALLQKDKEAARFACYRQGGSCETELEPAGAGATTSPALPPPSSTTLSIDALARSIITYAHPEATDFSPIIALHSECYPFAPSYVRAFTFPLGGAPAETSRKAYLANDAYFYELSQFASTTWDVIDNEALKAGIRLEYQNMANTYMCPDIGLLMSDIARITGPLELAKADTAAPAQRLRSRAYVTLADAAAYASTSDAVRTRQEYLEGSARFDELIRTLINDNSYVTASEREHSQIQFPYLFVARSYVSVLFLLGNPTFVPQRISLLSSNPLTPPVGPHSWIHELSKTMSESQVLYEAKRAADFFRNKGVI